eukprot:2140431-Pyramimonas_sp.AAC.1
MTNIIQPGYLKRILSRKKRLVDIRTSLHLCHETTGCWSRGAAKGMHGTTLSEVPGLFGERHELAFAANSGTMMN